MKKFKKELPDQALPEAVEGQGQSQEDRAEEGQTPESHSREEKMRADVELFHELFPQVSAKEVPQEVWEQVEEGQSLAASFALYTLQKEREEERIRKVNQENEASAPPKIRHDGADGGYYSPEMVKNMTPAEVRKHYSQILQSMDQWN